MLHKPGQCARKCASVLTNNGGLEQSADANGNWCHDVNVCLLWQSWTKTGCLRAMCRQRAAVARVLATAARAAETQTSAFVVDMLVIDDLIARVETRVAVLCGKRGHFAQACRSSGVNASARVVEADPLGHRRETSTRVGTVSLRHFGIPLDVLSVLRQFRSRSDSPQGRSWTLMLRNTWCRWQTGKVWVSRVKPAQDRLRCATGSFWQFRGAWDGRFFSNGGVDSFGGDSSYQVSVFSDETDECWSQH